MSNTYNHSQDILPFTIEADPLLEATAFLFDESIAFAVTEPFYYSIRHCDILL